MESWISLCVPTTMSTFPAFKSAIILFCSLLPTKRDNISMRIGRSTNLSCNVSKCCFASSVVGTNMQTCFSECTAKNAARIATSVFPKPTSPQTKRSIGVLFVMSVMISLMTFSWSAVSSKGKLAANCS